MKLKKILTVCFFFEFSILGFSKSVNNMELVKSGHWIYDAMNTLCSECEIVPLSGNAPLSVGELKMTFRRIDEEKLSESGKALLSKSWDFLSTRNNQYERGPLKIYGNAKVTPEFYLRTNENIPWSFQYNFKDNFLSFNLGAQISDYFVMEMEPFVTRSYGYVHHLADNNIFPKSFSTNIEWKGDRMEFEQPRWAYASTGYTGDSWGVNFVLGKEGVRHGNSLMGSIVYNDSFLTDFYSQFNIFTDIFKFSMDVTEVELNRYLYLHQYEFNLFKKFKFSVLEGSFVNAPFDLRYVNPVMIQHSHGGWYEYKNKKEYKWYGDECHFCAYMCFLLEYNPVKNLRLYLNYAQTEIQTSWEVCDVPCGLGGQFGAEYRLSSASNGYWIFGVEGVYTSPWLYIKNGKEWSLISYRSSPNSSGPLESWIGFPYGPDCLGGQVKAGVENFGKWNAYFSWTTILHGQNRFGMFTKNRKGYYDYFPSVKIKHTDSEEEKELIRKKNADMFPSGCVEYLNKASVEGTYIFNSHFSLSGKALYSFIYNFENKKGNFQNGMEFSLSGTYSLF